MKKLTKDEEQFWSKLPVIPGNPKFRQSFFRQLFCKHRFDNFQSENGWASFLMCTKCGKRLKHYSSFLYNLQKNQGDFVGLDSEEHNLCDFCGVLPKSNESNYCNACKHENLS